MKKCPFCAEEIQDDAIKCRYCGEFLKKKNKWLNCFLGCLVGFIVFVVLAILLLFLSFTMLKYVVFKIFFSGPHLPGHSLPFMGQGMGESLNAFMEGFSALWDKLMNFLRFGSQGNTITF